MEEDNDSGWEVDLDVEKYVGEVELGRGRRY